MLLHELGRFVLYMKAMAGWLSVEGKERRMYGHTSHLH